MSLTTFFDTALGLLRGEIDAEAAQHALGPCPTGTEALAYQARLHRSHRLRQLAELLPSVAARVNQRGPGAWERLVADFLAAHPPHHWSTPRLGAPFADWALANDPDGAVLGPLADWHWTRWLARHAPNRFAGDGLDVRLFVRSWPTDAPRLAAALQADPAAAPAPTGPATALIWRHEPSGAVRHRTPSLATLLILGERAGQAVPDALPAPVLAEERERLLAEGAILSP